MSVAVEGARTRGSDALAEVTQERDQLLKNEKIYKQRILQLEEEVKAVVKQSQELSDENRQLRERLESLDSNKEASEGGGSQEISRLRKENQELAAMVAKTTGEKQQLEFDNDSLQSKLTVHEEKGIDTVLASENSQLKAQQADMEKRIDALEKEKNVLETKAQKAQSEQKDIMNSLQKENSQLNTQQAEMQKRIDVLEKERHALQAKAQNAQKDNTSSMQKENQKLKAEVENLQTKNDLLERKVHQMQADNKEMAQRMEQKREELDELMRAMKTETTVEVELKEVNQELQFAKSKLADHKNDLDQADRKHKKELDEINAQHKKQLDEMGLQRRKEVDEMNRQHKSEVAELKRKQEVLEKESNSTKDILRLKESELKGVKANWEEKDSQIADLKRQLDSARRNVKRLEADLEEFRQVEKDSASLKARVLSLKTEIEDSLSANHKLKEERSEAKLQADHLKRELAIMSDALAEARRTLKKQDGDRVVKSQLEEDVKARRQRERELERRVYELIEEKASLKKRMHELQEDKERLVQKSPECVTEAESQNRKLKDDNKRLRQQLVDSNMELAQRQSECNALAQRLDDVEHQQRDSDMQVQQLRSWVDSRSGSSVGRTAPRSLPQSGVNLPPVHTAPHQPLADRTQNGPGDPERHRSRRVKPRPQHDRQNALNRSWEDVRLPEGGDDSLRTTPGSLPVVLDASILPAFASSSQPGYLDLYKNKLRLARDKRW